LLGFTIADKEIVVIDGDAWPVGERVVKLRASERLDVQGRLVGARELGVAVLETAIWSRPAA
jgi:hypothetical protein